jgi:hypothetical protein
MKRSDPTPAQVAFRDEMVAALRKHQHLPPDEMLAVAAYFVGQLVALQDQRWMTPAMAMEIVAANIEAGNQHALAEVMAAPAAVAN